MIKRKHSAQTFILVKSKYFIFRKMPNTIYFSADWIYLSASFDSFQTFIDGTNWNFVILNMQASLSSNSSPVSEKKHQALSYKKKRKKKKEVGRKNSVALMIRILIHSLPCTFSLCSHYGEIGI